ncbi:MAG: cell surface protein SprA, partial [Flavobacteriales bacterium]|nr:cell surface protein SprA [Flavobacteriales bacterium]
TAENYSAFVVDLSPDSLLCVGKNYVTTVQRSAIKRADGTADSVVWVEMRIPLCSPAYKVGTGMNPSAVSAMRMYFSGVESPLVWRMAVFELEKNDWKAFVFDDDAENDVTVGSVSVVKNSARTPIAYLPPEKVNRERVRSGLNSHYADEASLSFTAKNVPSGALRGVYRNVEVDMLGAQSVRLFLHLEGVESSTAVGDDDFYSVLRFGGDNTENYYQAARQVRPTQWGALAAEQIWQEENEINIPLETFTTVKKHRDEKIRDKTHPDAHTPYTENINGYQITVCGYPSLSMVRTVVIGVKNNSAFSKSATVWADELRVEVGKKRIGWATEASLRWNMSSLASFDATVGYSSSGMNAGRYSSLWYKAGAVVQVGSFLPEKWNVVMPVSFSVGKWIKTPVYSGDMSDVKYNDADEKTRSFLRSQTRSVNLGVSLSFAAKEGLKAKLWSVQNFSLSYALLSTQMNDFYTQDYALRSHLFSAGYNYVNSGGFLSPFSKTKKQWLKNISVKPMPSSLYFKVQAKRYDVSSSLRDFADENTAGAFSFLWDYTVGYNAGFVFDLTKNLKISFSAIGSGVVDIVEPTSAEQRRSALTDVFSTGRSTAYHQRAQVGYRLPFHFFTATDWIDVKTQYTADFYWRAGSTSAFYDDNMQRIYLGNVVQNASTFAVSAGFDFLRCFSKAVKQDGFAGAVQKGKKYPWSMRSVLRRADVSYRYTEGTLLPGYMGEAGFMGVSALGALGWDFMMGRQTDALRSAFIHGEITLSGEYLTEQVARKKASVLSYSVDWEPAPHLVINLKGGKEENRATLNSFSSEYDPVSRSYVLNTGKERTSGSMSVSRWAWRSSFDSNDENTSETMNRMRALMPRVAGKLAERYGINTFGADGFPIGLPKNHPDVLTYSFLGAYLGGGENVGYNLFNKVPLPEISVEYTGIGFLPAVRDIFSSVRLWSKYSAWYSINDFSTNELWGSTVEMDMFPQQYVFSSVNVVEAFAPLVGVEVKMKNGVGAFFSYTRDRMVSLSVASSRVSETMGRSYSFGGSAVVAKKWTVGADAVLRKNYTTLYNACAEDSQVSSGERFTSVKCSVGYSLGKNLSVGFTVYALFRGYMLPQMPTTFSTTGTFNVKYNIGE